MEVAENVIKKIKISTKMFSFVSCIWIIFTAKQLIKTYFYILQKQARDKIIVCKLQVSVIFMHIYIYKFITVSKYKKCWYCWYIFYQPFLFFIFSFSQSNFFSFEALSSLSLLFMTSSLPFCGIPSHSKKTLYTSPYVYFRYVSFPSP